MSITSKTVVVALVGLPRSGTTLLARLIGAHSQVSALIEPYQRRRQLNYEEADVRKLYEDYKVEVPVSNALLIKETATRTANIAMVLRTLRLAAEAGHPTGIILLLRSPIESFYSQVAAAKTYWKGEFGEDQNSLYWFWHWASESLEMLRMEITCFQLRVCLFNRLLSDATTELARLMAFFPLQPEPEQFDVETARQKGLAGGDPSAWVKDRPVSQNSATNRTAQITQFQKDFGKSAVGRQMLMLHACVAQLEHGELFDDDEMAERFFLEFRKASTMWPLSADARSET